MLKLIKFEFQKKYKMILSTLLAYQILTWFSSFQIKKLAQGHENFDRSILSNELPGICAIIIVLASLFVFLSMLYGENIMHHEIKKPTKNLYFSIPCSGYKITGAKLIVSVIINTISVLFAGYTAMLSIAYITNFEIVSVFHATVFSHIGDSIKVLLLYLVSYAAFLCSVYCSHVLYKAFFSQIKFGKVIVSLLYIGFWYVYVRLIILIPFDSIITKGSGETMLQIIVYSISTITLAAFYFITGYLIESKINLD